MMFKKNNLTNYVQNLSIDVNCDFSSPKGLQIIKTHHLIPWDSHPTIPGQKGSRPRVLILLLGWWGMTNHYIANMILCMWI